MVGNLLNYQFRVSFKYLFITTFVYSLNAFSQCDLSESSLKSGLDLFNRKQYLLSLQEFSLVKKMNCPQFVDKGRWAYLLALTELNEVDEMYHLSINELPKQLSSEYLNKLKVYQSYYYDLNEGTAESQKVEIFKSWKSQLLKQPKSSFLAGGLSAVVPGLGQAYVGTYQSGAMAFLLNALFLSSTLEFQNKGLYSASLISGVVFSITYLGNILNASQSAVVFNQNYNSYQIEQERRRSLPELYP